MRRLMTAEPVTVRPGTTVGDLVENYVYKYYFDLFPVAEGSHLLGCVGTRQIKEVPRERWGSVTAGEIAAGCTPDNTIGPDRDAVQALSQMRRTGNNRLMVVEDGRLVGILVLKDMLELLALKMDLEGED